ncbi:MAG: DAK2 domain-containing protein [Limnochordaceae bacterium]|nr:DAK2 domain-containing protein [Limnochordaceae bacterium]
MQWFGVTHFLSALSWGVRQLGQERESINALNVFPVPDGDTGTNMFLTASRALEEATAADRSLATCAQAAARGALMGARGNSGVILSQFFRGFAQGCAGRQELSPIQLAAAIRAATETAYRAVITPVEGTILSVGKGLARGAERAAYTASSWREVVTAAYQAGQEALAHTPEQLPLLKRAGVVDAGGQGLLTLFRGLVELAEHEEQPLATFAPVLPTPARESLATNSPAAPAAAETRPEPSSHRGIVRTDLVYRYCTEFLVRNARWSAQQIKDRLQPLGDSLLVVGDPSLFKIHVHTNHPGEALEIALQAGEELSAVHINNMSEQNEAAAASAAHSHPDADPPKADPPGKEGDNALERGVPANGAWPPVQANHSSTAASPVSGAQCAAIAVAAGSGFEEILRSLGVAEVVSGGQTMNPSTQELLDSMNRAPAPSVVVLPNNKNIFLTAKQAARLSSKEVHVLDSTSVPQGISALLAFRPDLPAAENIRRMRKRLAEVRTGAITYAVRDTEVDGRTVKAGDYLSIIDGQVVAGSAQLEQAAEELLRRLVQRKDQSVTIYWGEGVDSSQVEVVRRIAQQQASEGEVDVYPGGQPVYYFLIAVE